MLFESAPVVRGIAVVEGCILHVMFYSIHVIHSVNMARQTHRTNIRSLILIDEINLIN